VKKHLSKITCINTTQTFELTTVFFRGIAILSVLAWLTGFDC